MDDKQVLQRSEHKEKREPGLARASNLSHMGEKAKLRGVLCEMIQMVNYSHSREIKPTLVQNIHVRMEQTVCDNRNMGRNGWEGLSSGVGGCRKRQIPWMCVTHRKKGNMISTVVVTDPEDATERSQGLGMFQ